MATINFNGQEYDNPDAMPPEVRQLYDMANQMLADKDGDGIPDVFGQAGATTKTNMVQTTQFVVDGKVYTSLDDLPADARQKYEQSLGKWDANRNGIPDMFEGGGIFGATVQASSTPAAQPAPAPQPMAEPQLTTVVGDSLPSGVMLLIGGLVVLLLIAVAVIFFLAL